MQRFANQGSASLRGDSVIANQNQPLQSKADRYACGGACPRCQTKSLLHIGAPDDPYEREADAVAERVMRMAEPEVTTALSPATVRRQVRGLQQR